MSIHNAPGARNPLLHKSPEWETFERLAREQSDMMRRARMHCVVQGFAVIDDRGRLEPLRLCGCGE